MTRRCSSRGKIVESGCHQIETITSSCSPTGSPNPKHPKVSPRRRQSRRLKAINAIYKMADTISSELQQTSPENSPCNSKEIKVESVDTLDDPRIAETLKDMRKRCKAKRQKAVKSFGSSYVDLNHARLKTKEEEPDLDEPLIYLKLKKLNNSSASRKGRKCSLFPGSSRVEEISVSSPVESNRSSILKEVASGAKFVSTTESVTDSMEVETRNAVSSSTIIIDNCSNLDGSSTELSKRGCKGELANSELYCSTEKFLYPCVINCDSSPPTISQMEATPVVDISQPVVSMVKREAIEMDSLQSEIMNDVSSSSRVDFIAKLSSVHERNSGVESTLEDVTMVTADPLCCCVNEISVEFEETDNCTSVPESCKVHFGEKINVERSEISRHNFSSSFSDSNPPTHCAVTLQLVSETTDLISDVYCKARNFDIALEEVICDGIRNHLRNLGSTQECTSIDNNMEPRMIKDVDNRGDDEPSPMSSICCNEGKATAERGLHSRDFHDFCHASRFSEEVGSLDSLVLKALCGNPWRHGDADHANFLIEKSSAVETYNLCSLQHSNMIPYSSYSWGDSNEISPEKEDVHCSSVVQMLKDHIEKAADSAEIDRAEFISTDSEKSCFKRTCDLSIPVAEKKLYITGDKQPCLSSNKSNLVEGEDSNVMNEVKSDQGVEHHPKKLLSNRTDLSPMSQEMLRRALTSSELDDTMKTANDGEAELMLSPERMAKRSKSSRNGSVQRVSKGVLKSPNTPDRNCSCAKNSLINTQAQKAVTFSLRQMQDIETIATKLLNGLTSMKNIVMENVTSEACLSTSPKFTPEEVNVAIENASNLEATTKKWLSMMAKDCNRFCKIMKATENKEATPASLRKQPKKITFADEAGGLLCHVKVFEKLPEAQ